MKTFQLRSLLISIFSSLALTILCFLLFHSSESIPGPLYIISVISQYSTLIIGTFLLMFRMGGFLKYKNFGSILLGVANTWLGIIFLYIYLADQPNRLKIWEFMPNLLVGTLLLIDAYWKRTVPANAKAQ